MKKSTPPGIHRCARVAAALLLIPAAVLCASTSHADGTSKTLVLFPLALYSDTPMDFMRQGARTMLLSRLAGGGIEVVAEDKVNSVMGAAAGAPVTERQAASGFARALGADYALFGSITSAAGGYSLDLALLDVGKDPEKLSRLSDAGTANQFIPRLADVAYQVRALIEGTPMPSVRREGPAPEAPAEPRTYKGLFSGLGGDAGQRGPTEKGLFQRTRRDSRQFNPSGSISVGFAPMGFDTGGP